MKKNESGFSLVEVVITMGIVSLIVVSLIGLIGPIQTGVREGNLAASASRLISTVDDKLNLSGEALAAAIDEDSALILVYQVRVKPAFTFAKDPTETDLNPDINGGIGNGHKLAPVARRSWIADEIGSWGQDSKAIDGPAFLVRVRAEKQSRLQPEQLTEKTSPDIQFMSCEWFELPIALSRDGWAEILKRDVILKTPMVLRP